MKKSIIYLGIISVAFSNVIFASNALNEQQINTLENVQITSFTSQNEQAAVNYNMATVLYTNKFYTVEEATVFDPRSVIAVYEKTIQEIVAENNQIIESSLEEVEQLSIETTIEDIIVEDNQIIESTLSNDFYPLDFEKINKNYAKILSNDKGIIVEDLKL